jgi:type IX secretion system PorP/SprF family membrane protein
MKRLFTVIFCTGLCIPAALAQVDPLYAQYLNNPFLINPAYTGMNNYLNAMAGFRKQWAGFDGSPTTLSATGHTSLINNKMGVGLIVSQDLIGENSNTFVNATYAYKLQLDETTSFSFGLQAGIMSFRSDNGELNPADPADPVFTGVQNSISPSFGAGVIVKNDKFFAGLSVPRMLKATTEFDNSNGAGEVNLYTQHFYGFASYTFLLSPRVRFKPSILVRTVSGAPLSWDLNAQFNIDERYGIGAFTRGFETVGLLAQVKFTQYHFGYVFELPLNSSVGTKFTSHDITLGVNLSVFQFHDIFEVSEY